MGTKNKKQPDTRKAIEFEPEKQSFKEHLREFRSRMLWIGGSFIVAAIIGFEFKDIIQGLITMQLSDLSLINLHAPDEVQSTVQISLFTGVIVTLPLAMFHAYKFVEPILASTRAYGTRLFLASSALVATAITYAFMLTIPLVLHGTIAHGQDAMIMHVDIQSFLNLAVTNTLVVAVLFQLPLAIIFVNNVKSLSKKKISWIQRIGVPVIVAASWIATPFTSTTRGVTGILLIAVPALVLFEASIIWAKKHQKNAPKVVAAEKPKQQPLTRTIEQPQERQEQPVAQPEQRSEKPSFVFNQPQVVLETEQLEPFPEEMFDAMLEDRDEYAYADRPEHEPLPSSLEVYDDPRPAFKATPAPVVAQAPRPAAPVVQQVAPVVQAAPVPVAIQRPAPIPRPIQQPQPVAVVPQQPAFRPQPVVTAAIPAARPQFTARFGASHQPLPQPIAYPQPVTKIPVYSKPITETLLPRQTQTPPLRNPSAPHQVVPFQMRPAQPYGNTIEGLLPA